MMHLDSSIRGKAKEAAGRVRKVISSQERSKIVMRKIGLLIIVNLPWLAQMMLMKMFMLIIFQGELKSLTQ